MKFANIKKGVRITEKMAQKLAINWYYKHKAYQLLRDGQISREDYESINR